MSVDIISEILDADRQAEETLKNAEEQCRQLAESTEAEKKRLEQSLIDGRRELEAAAGKRCDEKRVQALEQARSEELENILILERTFESRSSRWAEEIFSRITADI